MKWRIGKIVKDRLFVGGVLLVSQFLLMVVLIFSLRDRWFGFYWIFMMLSVVMVIYLVRKYDNPAYKIAWIIVLLTFPLFGGIFYLFWGNTPFNRARTMHTIEPLDAVYNQGNLTVSQASATLPRYGRLARYIDKYGGTPVWGGTSSEFFAVGEEQYRSMMEEFAKAERFIFMEYFILQEGEMWNSLLEILIEKVKQGVDVRVMYDDVGCIAKLPSKYDRYLKALGIKAVRFNKFIPTLNTYMNNRNHRKICVIDGNVGYMGGINLADEYINKMQKFGHWKDTGVLVRGQAVASMTAMFLQLWDYSTGTVDTEHEAYLPTAYAQSDGYVQPFGDSPMDNINVSETVYMQIINSAKRYVYITTPYLVLDNEMVTALCTAAMSGIDVRIVTPGIPDKKTVFTVTRSFYQQLMKAGVKIYEYRPGFIHAKMIVADDDIAVVGTINMDFRSFFLHFECGTVFYNGSMPVKVREDIEETIKLSYEIDQIWLKATPWPVSVAGSILRVFAPLM